MFLMSCLGFYRVNYDDTLWNQIEQALKSSNFGEIDEISRALILDDVFNFARASYMDYFTALDIASYLENETGYYPWFVAFNAFTFLRRRIGQDQTLEPFLRVTVKIYHLYLVFNLKSCKFNIVKKQPLVWH